ncbi:zeta toxin family protein [Lactobacillus sp. ESL0791]|uniref:zeta toxin family protein n=1 Tax=Lactobacillus sp. ESL0791 TaxID=2983234 RepID=UPI0023F8A68B|nr:zeta toxin family protein [Lactobacillus sp. ESL0791]MDF7637921.1 zeta toxin family protein [Lactobacillus sp. ESL0791]
MRPTFVLIRGNSGSGKTVLATALQHHFGYKNCLLLHQDVIRRDVLHADDHAGTPAVSLLEDLVKYGQQHYQITILEGILRKDVYGEMLQQLIKRFDKTALIYYLDIPFTIAAEHNQMKNEPFAEEKLRCWWREDDYLGGKEQRLHDGDTKTFCQKIIDDIEKLD